MFQPVNTPERSLFIQLMKIQERIRGRRLKGQEKLAHTLGLCHTVFPRVCYQRTHHARFNKKGKGHG
ncbi:hypothetical protein ECENHK_08620 [Enterobacter kobei]|nr:hypothetical protein ECENHK_08620 [Enterobacter kobei]